MSVNMLIDKIQLFVDSICNLECSFCHLENKDEKNIYNILNKQIKSSWLDSSYINNIKKLFCTRDADPRDVKLISIWGGEPLSGLQNLNNSIV